MGANNYILESLEQARRRRIRFWKWNWWNRWNTTFGTSFYRQWRIWWRLYWRNWGAASIKVLLLVMDLWGVRTGGGQEMEHNLFTRRHWVEAPLLLAASWSNRVWSYGKQREEMQKELWSGGGRSWSKFSGSLSGGGGGAEHSHAYIIFFYSYSLVRRCGALLERVCGWRVWSSWILFLLKRGKVLRLQIVLQKNLVRDKKFFC